MSMRLKCGIGTNPHYSLSNEDAFYKWTKVLEQGYEFLVSSAGIGIILTV